MPAQDMEQPYLPKVTIKHLCWYLTRGNPSYVVAGA